MPHSIFGPNQWGINQVVRTSGTTAANIRNLIDQGYQYTTHFEGEMLGSGTPVAADPLMIPGGVASTIPWGDIVVDLWRRVWGGSPGSLPQLAQNGNQLPIPIPGGTMTPEPGTLGGPVTCGPRPKVGYITLPDGTVGCPSGYHPEKSGRGYCVRNRRMNALNPRALSRASRRVGGFARAVKRARTLKRICKTL